MNKPFLLFLSLLITYSGITQSKSNLTISTSGTTNLKIRLGNARYSFQDRSTTFQGLQPGNYDLTVFQWQKKPDGSSDYIQVYKGSVKLTPNRHTEISILRFGKVAWDEGPVTADGWSDSYNNPSTINEQGFYQGQAVSTKQFTEIKKAISGEFGDDNMLRMAKVAMKNNLFTTAQLKEIINLLFSDDTKLNFAKYAYDFAVDKGNYITIAEALFSSAHKKALMDHISSQ